MPEVGFSPVCAPFSVCSLLPLGAAPRAGASWAPAMLLAFTLFLRLCPGFRCFSFSISRVTMGGRQWAWRVTLSVVHPLTDEHFWSVGQKGEKGPGSTFCPYYRGCSSLFSAVHHSGDIFRMFPISSVSTQWGL